MKMLICLTAFAFTGVAACLLAEPAPPAAVTPAVLNFTVKSLAGQDVDLSKYAGKVILIVNTASRCGFTPQYQELEALYEKYKDKGLVVLGFPANDFHNQEPGDSKEISAFCTEKYGVTFDMFDKVHVLGDEKAPLYKYLTSAETDPAHAGEVKWNFEKFLIARDGSVANRFVSKVKPSSDEVVNALEKELAR